MRGRWFFTAERSLAVRSSSAVGQHLLPRMRGRMPGALPIALRDRYGRHAWLSAGAASPEAIESEHANFVQSADVKPTANAVEIKVLWSNGYKAVMQELASQFSVTQEREPTFRLEPGLAQALRWILE